MPDLKTTNEPSSFSTCVDIEKGGSSATFQRSLKPTGAKGLGSFTLSRCSVFLGYHQWCSGQKKVPCPKSNNKSSKPSVIQKSLSSVNINKRRLNWVEILHTQLPLFPLPLPNTLCLLWYGVFISSQCSKKY